MRVLNVAEKNSVAREICHQLGGSGSSRGGQFVGEFDYRLNGGQTEAKMTVTAVRGHLMAIDFPAEYNSWTSTDPSILFTAPIVQSVQHSDLASSLRQLARQSDCLILWLDCDREGEGIAFEVLEVCLKANSRLSFFRAKFSALTYAQLTHALANLVQPNRLQAEAVMARSELDLRIGASFTRYLTLRYQQQGRNQKNLISFGGCQTVTLGFVVARWLLRQRFIPEPFWYLCLTCPGVELKWNRNRLFDNGTVSALHSLCGSAQEVTVVEFSQQPKSKWRPLPLNTLELTKLASTKLRIPSHQAMSIAETLYSKGLISYPRTETDSFSPSINLRELVALQAGNPEWGFFVSSRLLNGGEFTAPRKGKRDDQAHPPIHPLKSAQRSEFQSLEEYKIYELVTRHFIACCSPDALGSASRMEVQLTTERFHAEGLTVIEKNWLEIYPYVSWTSTSSDSSLPLVTVGQRLPVSAVVIKEGRTEAPECLSESELLSLMDKEGIGTDATMHEHIKTIQERGYCYLDGNRWFVPSSLGTALIVGLAGYEALGFHLGKPELRASMEADLGKICRGEITRQMFLENYCRKMKQIFLSIADNPALLDSHLMGIVTAGSGEPERRRRLSNARPKRGLSSARPKRGLSSARPKRRNQR